MLDWIRRLIRRGERPDTPAVAAPQHDVMLDASQADDRFSDGVRDFAQGRFAEAADAFAAALELRHDWAEAHHNLGLCMHSLGRLEDASDCYELALHFRPDFARVHLDRAYTERKRGAKQAALARVRAAIAAGHATAEAHNLEGSLLLDAEDVAGAVAAFERAVELDPDYPDANNNLGYVLFRDRAQYDRGARHIERALELDPDNPGYLCNYTMVLSHRGELDRTIELCNRILEVHPGMDEIRLNRGLALLRLGRFEAGWRDYEARKSVRCNYVPRDLPWPEWEGQPLDGKTILIYGEQGLGDEIMFASCFPDMVRRAGLCVVECEERLAPIFRRSFPGITVVVGAQTRGRPEWLAHAPPIDFQVATGSLPLYLRSRPEDFPAHGGYLRSDPERARRWRQRLDQLGSGLKIGVSWRGGMQSTRRDLRSIDLATLATLFDINGAHLVDLQYGDTRDERSRLQSERGDVLHSWPEVASDLDELAALVGELDLVVSVCTAVIHLAGALGGEVWVLVPAVPEWRYQQQGTRMPWYPSARVFRQRPGEDWTVVMNDVTAALHQRQLSPNQDAAAQENSRLVDAAAIRSDKNRQ